MVVNPIQLDEMFHADNTRIILSSGPRVDDESVMVAFEPAWPWSKSTVSSVDEHVGRLRAVAGSGNAQQEFQRIKEVAIFLKPERVLP